MSIKKMFNTFQNNYKMRKSKQNPDSKDFYINFNLCLLYFVYNKYVSLLLILKRGFI